LIPLADDESGDGELEAQFMLSPALTEADKELCDHDFSDAEAEIEIKKRNGMTKIKIEVEGAVLDEFYTAWLKLADPSPLTGIGATPLAPTTELGSLQGADGETDIVNGFFTDGRGNGKLEVKLDFLLGDGVDPFSSYDAALAESAIGDMPFTIRLASHRSAHVSHGLLPGTHERTLRYRLICRLYLGG
jgi:hypothetical protein